jgi:hypothetical protein
MISERIQNLSQLRRLLAERFPHERRFSTPGATAMRAACWPTGIRPLDALLRGGLPNGALTELVAPHPASGSTLVVLKTMEHVREAGNWLALVDAQDSFDPSAPADPLLAGLLWIRCRGAAQAMRAADLLLRDDNVPLAIVDLRLSAAQELRRIPSSAWYRLQRLIKRRACACLVITPFALVASAQWRVALESQFGLGDLRRSPDELAAELKVGLLRSHGAEAGALEPAAEAN